MGDFDFGPQQGLQGGPIQRKDTLGDKLGRVLGTVTDPVLPVFTMNDAWQFFSMLREKVPAGKKCMFSVKQERGRYSITQILLDAGNEPIRQTTKAYWGRTVKAQRLDPSVTEYLGNGTARIMELLETQK